MSTTEYNMGYNKSPLKWAGSKGKVLPILLPILEKYKKPTFVEPFVGAANVSLNLDADHYIWGDTNLDLLRHHRTIINFKDRFIEECEKFFGMGFDAYHQVKHTFNTKDVLTIEEEIERAAMFQYLNKHCFNGLCRYNSKGQFNTSIGTATKPKAIPYNQIHTMQTRFKSVSIHNMSFDKMFDCMERGSVGDCLIYCDPPYLPLTSSWTYDKNGFGMEQQKALAVQAKKSRHTTIISNHWTPEAEMLYSDATDIVVFDVQRNISGKGDARKKVQECIVVYEK